MKKWALYITLILSSLLVFLNVSSKKVFAIASQTSIQTILSNGTSGGVDRTVPNGLSDIGQWFNIPDIADNHAVVLPGNSTTQVTTGSTTSAVSNKGKADVIRLTGLSDANKIGAIWAKRDQADAGNQNYIDINKRQTMSMWMFFGGTYTSGGGNTGEVLGVWGSPYSINDTSQTLASRAIQNSWALNFDTFTNDQGTFNSNFDYTNSSTNQIANNYPSDAASYNMISGKGMALVKNNVINNVANADKPYNFLTDDRWHHITLTWTPATSTSDPYITLNYNDKNLDGTPKLNSSTGKVNTLKIPINLSEFNLKNGEDKLYWGFTGSTGSSTENNLVIFESIPSIVEADATSEIIDESSGDRVLADATTDNPDANVVYNGDAVNVNYNLKYLSGSQAWKDISADIKLPDKIDYNSAVITYTDTDGKTTTESIDEFKNMTNNEIVHKLAQSLDKTGITSANIKFEGTVNAGTTSGSVNVAAVNSSFDGSNLQKDVMTQAFIIKQPNKITLTKTSSDPVSLNMGTQANLNGKIAYSDTSTTIDSSKMSVVATVNGTEISKTTMSTILASGSTDTFALPISTSLYSSLKEGSNTVDIYVYNTSDYNASNHITYTVNVSGTVKVVSNPTSHFNPVQSYSTSSIVSRADDWSVDVIDSREKGATWKLSASSTPLTDGTKNFTDNTADSGIIFVNSAGKTTNITNNLTKIDSGTKSQDDSETFDVDKDWTKQTGILLKRDAYVQQGTYSAVITWTLGDSL